MAVLLEQVASWLLTATAGDQLQNLVNHAGQWPVPVWLGVWVDTAWLAAMQESAVALVQWLSAVLPPASSLMGWVSPLIWALWVLGLVVLLLLSVTAHWLVRRHGGRSGSRV